MDLFKEDYLNFLIDTLGCGDLPKSKEKISSYDLKVNVVSNENSCTLTAFLPGLTKEDLSVEVVEDDILSLSYKSKKETDKSIYQIKEFNPILSFTRTFKLRENIDKEKIRAEMKNGVLEVTLPEKKKNLKKIDVIVE